MNNLKRSVPYSLSALLILIFVIYLYQNIEEYRQIFILSFNAFLMLAALAALFSFGNGLINYFLYSAMQVPLSLNEGVGLAAVNTLANLLPFTGGLVAKGVYLKQRYQLSYTHFLSATVALYVCFFASNGLLGISILAYWFVVYGLSPPLSLVLGFGGMALMVLALWLPLEVSWAPEKLKKRLAQMAEGWHILGRNPSLLIKLVSVQLVMSVLFSARLWISFQILSQDMIISQCLLFSAATILTRLVSITPGALGIREGIVATIAAILGFDPGISVLAVGLDRLVSTLVIILIGIIYSYILSKNVTALKQV